MKLYTKQVIATFLCIGWALLIGCQSGPYAPVITTPQIAHTEVLGHSVQNRPIELITFGSGPDTTLIIATMHGNEDAGTPLVYQLMDRLRSQVKLLNGRTVLIVPLANPDGCNLRIRGNANGIDLNRNFPAENRVNNTVNGLNGLTEPESIILYNLVLTYRPDRVVSIHQPLYCLDYDGPADKLAQAMSCYCPLPVEKLGSRPGSMGSFVGVEQNIPIVTMELAKEDSQLSDSQLWTQYGYALLAAITYPEQPY